MTERQAAIAFILDRAEQLPRTSALRAFADELVAGLAEGRHTDNAAAGEYDDLEQRVLRIARARESITPLVKRPKLRSMR